MPSELSHLEEASEVHLLVHPGFISRGYGSDLLFDRYEIFADMLPRRALIFALMHFDPDAYPEGLDLRLLAMRLRLEDRLVIARGDFAPSPYIEYHGPQLDAARRRAEEQGYTFSPDTPTFAWGETLTSCVPDTAQNANALWGMRQSTMILPHLTNHALNEGHLRSSHETHHTKLVRRNPRIVFPPWEMNWGMDTQMRHLLAEKELSS